MTFYELTKTMANDVNVDFSEKKKLGEYINRAYKECAKRTKTDLPETWKLVNDEDLPLTHIYNDDFIVFYALYLYLTAKNVMDRAGVYKTESDNFKLKISKKVINVKTTKMVY